MQLRADLFVTAALEIAKPHHLALTRRQLVEKFLHFLESLQAGFGLGWFLGFGLLGATVGLGLHLPGRRPACQLVDANAPGDDRQVGRQAALPAKLPQDSIIVGHDLQQNLRGDVFDVLGRQRGAAQIGGVMNDVINQAQETIDKIVPGPWIVMQAAVKKCAVNGG